jgi:hypothetical protein
MIGSWLLHISQNWHGAEAQAFDGGSSEPWHLSIFIHGEMKYFHHYIYEEHTYAQG